MKSFTPVSPASHPFADQVFCTCKGFTIEVCRRAESLATAFRLRYRAYLGVHAIDKNEEELLYDNYDFLPNSRIHLVWYNDKPVATVRACIWSDQYLWTPTEAVHYFARDIEKKLGKNTRLLESNRYAVDPDFQGRQSLFAQMLMFRIHALNTAVQGCTHIVTAVRKNHIPFYRRFLGMELISEQAHFVAWADTDVSQLAAEREYAHETALKRGIPEISSEDIENYARCAELTFWAQYAKVA